MSDPTLLELVLRNIVLNAIRYTDRGGILIGCRRCGAYLSIGVYDTGIGIPKDQHEEIFREFYQVGNLERDRRNGLGLGLARARRLATSLDHPLSLSSKEGRGSVFRILVPTALAPATEAEPSLDIWKVCRLAGARILIVDDDPIVREAMLQLLKKWQCHCKAIAAPGDVNTLSEDQPAPDLLICDNRLREGMTGLNAIAMLRQHWGQQIPAISITGDTAPARLQETLKYGVPVIHKPVSPEKLYEELSMSILQLRFPSCAAIPATM